jgi:hypothetical protein
MQRISDEQFLDLFEQNLASLLEEYFFSKIVGVTHPNDDGSDRAEILAGCELFAVLYFEHKPENPVDPMAVAVMLQDTRQQLGYLPQRTAHDLLSRVKSEGGSWNGFLRETFTAPDSEIVIGANIVIGKSKPKP